MTLVLFGVFFLCLLIGIPVAFSIGLAAVAVLFAGDVDRLVVVQRMFAA